MLCCQHVGLSFVGFIECYNDDVDDDDDDDDDDQQAPDSIK